MKSDLLLAFVKHYYAVQRRNRQNAFNLASELTPEAIHFLLELDADPDTSPSELCPILGIHISRMSRLMDALEEKRFIHARVSPADARKKELLILPEGRNLIRLMDEAINNDVKKACQPFTEEQIEVFGHYQKKLADGFGVPEPPLRPEEHEFRRENRRLSRAFAGLKKNSFQYAGLSEIEGDVLKQIGEAENEIHAKDISTKLGVAGNTLSLVIGRLEEAELVKKVPGRKDKRHLELVLTDKGSKTLKEIDSCTVEKLRQAMSSFSEEEIQEFLSLYKLYSSDGPQVEKKRGSRAAPESMRISSVRS